MKTRVIHTKVWKDDYFSSLNRAEKILFLYLITNENINMCGIYEQNDKETVLWTGITNDELTSSKVKFEQDNKFVFRQGWVRVLNHDKYNTYGKGEKQSPALEQELKRVPESIFNTSINTSIDTDPILDLNHNTENINHKSKDIKEKKYTTLESVNDPFLFEGLSTEYGVSVDFVARKYDDLSNYCKSHGRTYKDYLATLRNFVSKDSAKVFSSQGQYGKPNIGFIDPK